MAAMGDKDADLITWVRATMAHTPEPEVIFHALLAANKPVAADNPANTGIPRSRINEGLKPTPLSQDSCPEEFRSWARHFLSLIHI